MRALLCPKPCWDHPFPECGGSGAVITIEMVPPCRAEAGGSSGTGGTSLSLVPKPHCRPRAHPPAPGHRSLTLCGCCSRVPVVSQDKVVGTVPGQERGLRLVAHIGDRCIETAGPCWQGCPGAACANATCLILVGEADLLYPATCDPDQLGCRGRKGRPDVKSPAGNISCSALADQFCNTG